MDFRQVLILVFRSSRWWDTKHALKDDRVLAQNRTVTFKEICRVYTSGDDDVAIGHPDVAVLDQRRSVGISSSRPRPLQGRSLISRHRKVARTGSRQLLRCLAQCATDSEGTKQQRQSGSTVTPRDWNWIAKTDYATQSNSGLIK